MNAAGLPPWRTILLAGVEPILRAELLAALDSERVRVVETRNGFAAMRAFSRERGEVDLLIALVAMPDYDGLALARGLTTLSASLPIVLVGVVDADARSPTSNVHFVPVSAGVAGLTAAARGILAAAS